MAIRAQTAFRASGRACSHSASAQVPSHFSSLQAPRSSPAKPAPMQMASDSSTPTAFSHGSHGIADKIAEPDGGTPKRAGSQPACADGATQLRIMPLLGKPYFSCIMCKSHVNPPFQVVVPRSLAPFLPAATAPAAVEWRGRSWEMRFTGGRPIQRLEAGWRGFAQDSGLRLGDGCVLELVDGGPERVVFRAQVLRADIPAAIRERAGGYTSSNPILIDD